MGRSMRIGIVVIVGAGIAVAGTATAAPRPRACANLARSARLVDDGAYDQALATSNDCLAVQPGNRAALKIKALALTALRDYRGAEAAYRAYAATEPWGANRTAILEIADDLKIAQSTLLEITVANGPATIYVDSRVQGEFCAAAPSCKQMVLPRSSTVIAERPGFERWSQRVAISPGATTKIAITLVEKPSLVTVRAPSGTQITIDGGGYAEPATLPAGKHRVAGALAGHRSARREIEVHEGKPVEIDLALPPIVPVQIAPTDATLLVDGKPTTVEDGSIVVEPGAHELVARARGFAEQRRRIPEARAADYRIEITLVPDRIVPSAERGGIAGRRKIAIAAGGVALAAGAAGVFLGLSSRSLDHDAFALCPSATTPCLAASEATSLNERARSRALQANVSFGVAGAAAVAGAILWLTGAAERRIAIAPRIGATDGIAGIDGIELRASF